MNSSTRIEFRTLDGTALRGDFFAAEGERTPAIAMTQGLTLLKEHYIADTARRFQQAGVSTLVYDHRSYGSSDGMPRHETNPSQQAEDYHDAVSALMRLPSIDPARIAVWGIGHSGGAAMMAAADDPRLKAAILNMPFISGAMDARNFPSGIIERAWRDRELNTATSQPEVSYVRVWPDSEENARGEGEQPFLAGEVPYKFIMGGLERSRAAGTPWENRMTLQSFYHIARVEPRNHALKIHAPTLYLTAAKDPLTAPVDEHRKVFATMGPNSAFKVLEPSHLATYFGEPFERAIGVQLDFLKRVL